MVENDNGQLKVTIRCLAYNHELYIRQCLDGFLMQKTNFRFEAIVHDDASTDGTAAIIREYAKKYPDIIKPIFETENQYSKRDGSIRRIMNEHTYGKYVAYCEGDDYWIDPLKLQKQVDFLEENPSFSAVFGNRLIFNEKSSTLSKIYFRKHSYSIFDVMSGLMPGLQNIMIRSEVLDVPLNSKSNGDLKLYYQCANIGKLKYLKEDFAVYRITGCGEATGRPKEKMFEISINHRYIFHKEMGFKNNQALVKSQIYNILQNYLHEGLDVKKISIIKKYHAPTILRWIWYPYYVLQFLFITFINIVRGSRDVSKI